MSGGAWFSPLKQSQESMFTTLYWIYS